MHETLVPVLKTKARISLRPLVDAGLFPASRQIPRRQSKLDEDRASTPPVVLVVDDEPDVRLALRLLLEHYGYEVFEASDGAEALRLLSTQSVSVMVTDLYMPGMDGIQLLRHVGSGITRAPYRVVAMSGVYHVGQPTMTVVASLLGADAVLDKPFSRIELMRALGIAIDEGSPDT